MFKFGSLPLFFILLLASEAWLGTAGSKPLGDPVRPIGQPVRPVQPNTEIFSHLKGQIESNKPVPLSYVELLGFLKRGVITEQQARELINSGIRNK